MGLPEHSSARSRPLLWVIRIFLLATVIIHIYATIQLAIENRRARPEPYIDKRYV